MRTFSFYIDAENYTYSFDFPTTFQGGQEFVVYDCNSEFRHPEFRVKPQGPIVGSQILTDLNTFTEDFRNFVTRLNRLHKPLEGQMLAEVLEDVCEEHINRYSRLLYNDLLNYVDLYIHINHAIFESPMDVYQDIYKFGVYRVLNKFPNNVVFQGPFGTTYTWADVPENS